MLQVGPHPLTGRWLIIGVKLVCNGPEMFLAMKQIQSLLGAWKAILGDVPDPSDPYTPIA
jgi:hypothetical protein